MGNLPGRPNPSTMWLEVTMMCVAQIAWSVPETEGHDDFVVSLALCCRAAEGLAPPAASELVRPKPEGVARW